MADAWRDLRRNRQLGNDWVNFVATKYKPADEKFHDAQSARDAALKIVREKLGDDYQDGYQARLPLDYPPVVKVDYLHFRRQWVR